MESEDGLTMVETAGMQRMPMKFLSGNCVPYACALAYMAKVIGYRNVYVCSRGTKAENLHTWTEINGIVYDSYFAKRRNVNKYYGIRYNKFDYQCALRQKLPEKYSWSSN